MSASSAASLKRTYDVIIFGATGYTGAIVVKYFLDSAPSNVRWAIAGRSAAKLEAVLAKHQKTSKDIPIILADSGDEKALAALCGQTKVVLTTVGPYALYGYPLVAACARSGTHYCDITGEPQYMSKVIDTLHDDAVKNKALIVSACGFDSVPGDLGNAMVHEAARKEHPGANVVRVTAHYQMMGAPSGGTLATGANALKDPDMPKIQRNPYCLTPTKSSPLLAVKEDFYPTYNGCLRAWTAPFVMARTNVRVVNRSNALLGVQATYAERLGPMSLIGSILNVVVMAVFGLIMLMPPLRYILTKCLKPGDGPSEAVRNNGWFKVLLVAELDNGKTAQSMVRSLIGDPGYKESAKMLSEAAITLALDYDALPFKGGVLPPAVALGSCYRKRLEAAGLEFIPKYDAATMDKKKQK
jgi:short subunit dehydrogenase-like uncharacterized protein